MKRTPTSRRALWRGGVPSRLFALGTTLLLGCGPSSIELDPKSVVDLKVRPASGQALFCPGDPFLVEVVAKMNDGSTCSSSDATRSCLGKTNRVIDPEQIQLGLTSGAFDPTNPLVVVPEADPLLTAMEGMELRASLVGIGASAGSRSMPAAAALKPVYDCRLRGLFGGGVATGPVGARGPDLTVAATSLSTPFYPDAMLVRVQGPMGTSYWVSPSSDRVLEIVAAGQAGAPGLPGEPGAAGASGEDRSAQGECVRGGDGGPGGNGTDGGPGGNGGDGGSFKLLLDDRVADKLLARLKLSNPGGEAGRAGPGGPAGPGGAGGWGGPTHPERCPDTTGAAGPPGTPGRDGEPGRSGVAGPPPVIERLAREQLFSKELGTLQQIESAKAAPR
jgi:hypothetical protein